MRGDYVEDANAYTAPVESYSPNDYGLYNMSGNVAEWTNTAFDETVYDFSALDALGVKRIDYPQFEKAHPDWFKPGHLSTRPRPLPLHSRAPRSFTALDAQAR